MEGRQGDYHRFEAVPNHWRKTPAFKELVIRRIPEPTTRMAGLRAGRDRHRPGLRRLPGAGAEGGPAHPRVAELRLHWVILTGQTTPDREDYCPTCPWAGDPNDTKSLENARKVRLAMNLAVNKKAIISGLWKGDGGDTPYSYYYYPFHKGYSTDWKIPPYDPERAKKLLAEAGHAGGFEVRVNPTCSSWPRTARTSWRRWRSTGRRSGSRSKRVPEATQQLRSQGPPAEDEQDALGLRLAALRRAGRSPGARPPLQGRLQPALRRAPTTRTIDATMREFDPERRAKLISRALGQKLYDGYHGVMLGMKSITWALSRKVGTWQTLAYVPAETNYDGITVGS